VIGIDIVIGIEILNVYWYDLINTFMCSCS